MRVAVLDGMSSTSQLARSRATRLVCLAGLSLAFAGGGCITTSEVRPGDLPRLDGYQANDPARATRAVQTLDGGEATLRPGSTLALDGPDGRVGGRFTSIAVRDGVFRGQTVDGRTVMAPLDRVRAADISRHDGTGTVIVVAVGILAFATGAWLWSGRAQSHTVTGRALRIGRVVVAAPPSKPAADDGWRATATPPDTSRLSQAGRDALGAFWAENARAEHASVPAFSRLALTLVALGAPARLVEAAHRAALEEIDHARRAFALAAAYGDAAAAPGPLVALGAAPAVTAASLEALAAESLVDGCLLEGIAAAVAAEALARAQDPAVRQTLAVIVRDERSHAELGWEVLTWCCATGGPSVARSVHALASRLPDVVAPTGAPALLREALSAHGWLAPPAFRQVARRTRVEVAARATTLAASFREERAHAA